MARRGAASHCIELDKEGKNRVNKWEETFLFLERFQGLELCSSKTLLDRSVEDSVLKRWLSL